MRLYEIENTKKGTFYYTPKKDKLPDDMINAFSRLAHQQRHGGAEHIMNHITRKYPLMWLGSLLEHLGDLIHATSDCVNFNGAIVRSVDAKLSLGDNVLSNLNANLRDLAEQNKQEAKSRGMSEKEYVQLFVRDMEKYGEAHFNLPAYNEIHLLCKKVTTSLAAMEFEECHSHIKKLLAYSNDGTLNKRCLTITRGNNGKIKVIG